MTKLFKALELPHVYRWKRQWLRRVMIILMIPQELVRAAYGVFVAARNWWRWDGTVSPDKQFTCPDGTTGPAPVFKR